MAYIDFQRFFVRFKIVFYGPGLSGKSSNLQALHELTQEPLELVMLDREEDDGITCDYMPLKLGQLRGIDTVFKLYSVPGQVRYARARRMVLKDVDGIVFVADSQAAAMDDNRESLEELRHHLSDENISLDDIPIVFQYNKRDLDDIVPVDELNERLNPGDHSWIPAAAVRRENVKETLTMIAKLVFTKAAERYDLIPTRPEESLEARGSVTGGISKPGQPAVSMGAPSIEVGPLLPPLSDLPEDEISAAIPTDSVPPDADGVQFPITRPPAAMQESSGRKVAETVVYLMEERILCRLDDMEAMLQSIFTRVTSIDGEGVANMLGRIEESGGLQGGGDAGGMEELKTALTRLQGTVESASLGGASFSDDPMLDVLEQMKTAIGQMSQSDHGRTLEDANQRMGRIESVLQEHMVRSQESERRLQDLVAQLGYSSVAPDDPAAYADVPAELSEGIAESLAVIEKRANERGELDVQQAVAALRDQLDRSHQQVAARASLQPPVPMDDAADLQLEQRQIAETVNEIREIVGGVSVELDRVRRTYRSLRQDIQKDIKNQIEDQLAAYLREMDQGPQGPGPRETGSPGSYSMSGERRK